MGERAGRCRTSTHPGRRIIEHIREKGLDSEVEFITVALPSWNIDSERASLDHHFDLLDPDYVIWSPQQSAQE